jgi:L-methionine (R)-S-oxide reductase
MDGDAICRELEKKIEEGMDFNSLKELAVAKVHESHERFHWTGIYELFPDNTLRLGPFIGAPTDHVFIGVGQGVCGTAVAEGRNMNIPDVNITSNYLACSAETSSELVVLIRSGEKIHGQIDLDSNEIAAFDDSIENEVQKVADFLARHYDGWSGSRAT